MEEEKPFGEVHRQLRKLFADVLRVLDGCLDGLMISRTASSHGVTLLWREKGWKGFVHAADKALCELHFGFPRAAMLLSGGVDVCEKA